MFQIAASALLLFSTLSLAKLEPEVHELHGEVVAIADGDTLTVLDSEKVQHKVRLQGIDAPEKKQAFGNVARKALGDKLHRKTVRVTWTERDRYKRIVGVVDLEGRNVNQEMVSEGHAWWFRKYAPTDRQLEQAETEARKERRGLWHDDKPVPPWEWRKNNRRDSSPEAPQR